MAKGRWKGISNWNAPNWDPRDPVNPFRTPQEKLREIESHPFQGKMVIAKFAMPPFSIKEPDTDEIKVHLANMLAQSILNESLVEFRKIMEHDGTMSYYARCFLMKDGDIHILRKYKNE